MRSLERAEILSPGERLTRTAVVALAMYDSQWWVSVPPTGPAHFNGCVYLRVDGVPSFLQADTVRGEIPWR